MVQINFAQKRVSAKIVYYGPGMSGKTTNLEVVHQRAPDSNRGELTSISTDGDRTLFFDYMPLDLGMVAGMHTCFQLYTVPGQVYYNSTRKLVLQGVDGVIFVADSSRGMLEQNLESLRNLEENLNEYGKSLHGLPHVIQYNKRDLPDAMPIEELNEKLNRHGVPYFEGVANTGQGVFPTLKRLAAMVLQNLMSESKDSVGSAAVAPSSPRQQEPAPQVPVNAPASQQSTPHEPVAPAASVAPLAPSAPAAPAAPVARVAPVAPALAPRSASSTVSLGMSNPHVSAPAAPAVSPMPMAQEPAASPSRRAPTRGQAVHRVPLPRPVHPRGVGSKVYTAAFVVLAAAVGALLASVVLSVA